ncbi:MAG: chromosomal replication initiator protein DnaA [Sandaracinaceae bacterium]|jgi:chromosomal replication initiator protein|nr:chromosomal replication initiator protein DnaA [Sandaracinaceae bacterium]
MNELWADALETLRNRLSSEAFETWFAPIQCDGQTGDSLQLRVPNRFYVEWLSTHYLGFLHGALREKSANDKLTIEWTVDENLQERVPQQKRSVPAAAPTPSFNMSPSVTGERHEATLVGMPAPVAAPMQTTAQINESARVHGLNTKYSFDNFVVGPSNQLAHAAAFAAASSRGKKYNPLFIYGGTGLGKTHLVNAVGHRILQDRPSARVLYLSAERFTNEFIFALQTHKISEFRERYRNNCDVLLMDDIQFLAGREQTQEEFFHTFNALYHSDRQIVVTSDVYPQLIPEMQERLISRFQWGLVADIQAPELDTRIAILRRKAAEEGIEFADDVALFLAQVVKSNVRELEGTLLRLAVRADLVKRVIDLDFAKETLRAVLPLPEHATSVEDIQQAVCKYFNIRLADLKSHRRHRAVSYPRMVAMYLCRQRLGTSFPQLGELFGGKDHTTVLSAVKKIGGLVEKEDPKVRGELEAIERKLGF